MNERRGTVVAKVPQTALPDINRRDLHRPDRRRLPRGGRRSTDRAGLHPYVILADSYEAARTPWSRYLRTWGFHVEEAQNGEEVLALVAREVPQLIVMELELPQWPAWCLTVWLGLDPRTSSIPIIVTAGDVELGRIPELPKTAGFLMKPFKLEAMLGEIRRVLACALPAQTCQE
jgi:two-component system, OmpR family, phosphate regulon response regulator PhoB